jgi:hypothetical protein
VSWKTTSISLKMEDDIEFFEKMEDDLNCLAKLKTTPISWLMEDNLNSKVNRSQTQGLGKWKTTSTFRLMENDHCFS